MKLNEVLLLLNKELEVLNGVKIKDANEYHKLKKEILAEQCQSLGLETEFGRISYKLGSGSDIVDEHSVSIFEINLEINKDKRYKNSLTGRINKVELTYYDDMEKYADIELDRLNDFYTRDVLIAYMKENEEKIKSKMQEIERRKETILKCQEELEKLENII